MRQSLYIYWAHGPRMLRMVRFGTIFVQYGLQGSHASEFVSVTRVLIIFYFFAQFLPLIILVAYSRPRLGRCRHCPHLDESRPCRAGAEVRDATAVIDRHPEVSKFT